MAGNGDIRDSAVDGMVAVDRNGLVDHYEVFGAQVRSG